MVLKAGLDDWYNQQKTLVLSFKGEGIGQLRYRKCF